MAKPKTALTGKEKPADPSVDWLGEKAWKAVAHQQAIETAAYMLRQRGVENVVPPDAQRELVDGILGVIGPAWEAAIRDAVLDHIDLMIEEGGRYPGDYEGRPDLYEVVRFLWRWIPINERDRRRKAVGHGR